MSQIARKEQYELELRIHQFAPDAGVQAVREWLKGAQDALNATWHRMEGDTLIRAQGYAGQIVDLLRVIEVGPKIPAEEKPKQ